MKPEEAAVEARRRAAAARERGAYADDLSGPGGEPLDTVTIERLLEWAAIEPDVELVYSTRRYGGPITAVKRGLVRALRQYHDQAFAQQTRFNIQLAVFVSHLADRVARLEERGDAADDA